MKRVNKRRAPKKHYTRQLTLEQYIQEMLDSGQMQMVGTPRHNFNLYDRLKPCPSTS